MEREFRVQFATSSLLVVLNPTLNSWRVWWQLDVYGMEGYQDYDHKSDERHSCQNGGSERLELGLFALDIVVLSQVAQMPLFDLFDLLNHIVSE